MIYASLKPIPAWRHPLVLPVYLLFALLTGLALLFALMLAMLGNQGMEAMLLTLAIVAALLVALKWLYWHAADRAGLPGSRAAAVGLPGREATVRSEEHTSELQSLMRISYAVFCLKKKNKTYTSSLHTTKPFLYSHLYKHTLLMFIIPKHMR